MDYLTRFNNDLFNKNIQVRNKYVNHSRDKNNNEPDVISDLMDQHKYASVACLPIAKQIITFDQKICFKLPKLGDLFIGLLHHKVIESVNFIISNYLEEITVNAQLCQDNNQMLWKITELPIILLNINDYENININVQVNINNEYNLQKFSQDVFKGYYGYFNQDIRQTLANHIIYHIPLLDNKHHIKIICGIWTIV